MAIDTTTPRTRRALLAAALGGTAAAIAATVARVEPAAAATGDDAKVGKLRHWLEKGPRMARVERVREVDCACSSPGQFGTA